MPRLSWEEQRRRWDQKRREELMRDKWRRESAHKEGEKVTYHFETPEAAALFVEEIQGQLSDGMWENARPQYHWCYWCNGKTVVDGKLGYSNGQSYRGYSQDFRDRYNVTALLDPEIDIQDRMKGVVAIAKKFGFDEDKLADLRKETNYFEDLDKISELTGMSVEEIQKIKLRPICAEINKMFKNFIPEEAKHLKESSNKKLANRIRESYKNKQRALKESQEDYTFEDFVQEAMSDTMDAFESCRLELDEDDRTDLDLDDDDSVKEFICRQVRNEARKLNEEGKLDTEQYWLRLKDMGYNKFKDFCYENKKRPQLKKLYDNLIDKMRWFDWADYSDDE